MEIANEHENNEENHGLDANPLRIAVSVAVPDNYWYHQQSRKAEALNKLYANLFYAENNELKIQAAQDVWQAIKKNPQSPEGPLTLSAISQAILISADFNNPSDSRAFFEFLQHNLAFQKLFSAIMLEKLDDTLSVGQALHAIFVDPPRYAVDRPRDPGLPPVQDLYELHEEANQQDGLRHLALPGLVPGDIALEDLDPEDANTTSEDSGSWEDVLEPPAEDAGIVLGGDPALAVMEEAPPVVNMPVNRPQENLLSLESLVVDDNLLLQIEYSLQQGGLAVVNHAEPPAQAPIDDIDRLVSIWLSGEPNLAAKIQAAVHNPAVIKDLFEFAPAVTEQLHYRRAEGQFGWCLESFARLCPEVLAITLHHVERAPRLHFYGIFSTQDSLIELLTSWLSSDARPKVDAVNINVHPLGQEQALELEQQPQQEPGHVLGQVQDDKGKQEKDASEHEDENEGEVEDERAKIRAKS